MESFPATCGHFCAKLLVPYVDQCGAMIGAMADTTFPSFSISKMVAFSGACRQTLVLHERGSTTGICASETDETVLQSRVDEVMMACCEQEGQNTCVGADGRTVPVSCDAVCAGVFLPYFTNCLGESAVIGGEMHQFTVLFTACTDGLPEEETRKMYEDVVDLDDSPECDVDISLVISRAEAKKRKIKPVCEQDAFPVCEAMISGGLKECKVDYCETCPEAHSCDAACGLPCAGGIDDGGGADAGGGHRLFLRMLAETMSSFGGWLPQLATITSTCPWASFESRLAEVDAACCHEGEVVCHDGIPDACPYRCGRLWTAFKEGCQTLLGTVFDNLDHLNRFTGRCLDVDPESLAMALDTAQCAVCGDGVVRGAEQCDDGAANADAPGAACRTNCRRAHCGDEIVDPGEECDDGARNCGSGGTIEFANPSFDADAVDGYSYQLPADWYGVSRAPEDHGSEGVVVVQNGHEAWGGLSSGDGANFLSIQGSGAYVSQVRKTPSLPRNGPTAAFSSCIFPLECMGQLASFGPT
jgi:hypothetical protein